ncbi:MAG: efflux RND transporter periplasmic adaptor subunit [Cyanobacteria bacterium J06621_12]
MATNYIPQSESDHKPSTESLKSPQKKRGKFFYLLLGVGGLGLIFLLARPFSIGSSKSTSTETVARVLPVETIKVEPVESYEVLRTYTGEIAAIRTSNLGFSRGGEIEEVLVEEGDRINRGQALARLDIRNLQTQRQQLEAEKARAQAQLSELRTGARIEDINAAKAAVQDLEQQLLLQSKQRERREFLYKEGAIAREQLDEFSFGEGALQARLSQARSNLAELENGTRQEQIDAQRATVQQLLARIADLDVTIDKSTLKAPFDGIVAKRDLDEGTVANAGQSVVRLMENAAPEARIGVPTNVVGKLQVGGTQALKIGSQTYEAKVASILPEVNANTRTQTVVFQLDPSAITRINPGQTIRLELAQEIDTEGYWLPTDALTQGIRGLWTCYVLTESEDAENYIVKQHSVEIINQQGDRALVRGTLQPGDRIVANGTHRLVPGQQVEVASSE